MMMNTQMELLNFKNKIRNQRAAEEDFSKVITTEMYMATVKKVNSSSLTVDVFITKLNAEVKEVQVLMPSMSPTSGKISLPQVNTAVVIMFASYMKPFVIASIPFLDDKIHEIYKNESVDYTQNTFTKHTLNGSIINMVGSKNASCIDSDGSNNEYNTDVARYSKDGYELNITNDELGNLDFKKIDIKYDDSNVQQSTLDKLYALRTKLDTHRGALKDFRGRMTQNGFDKESILNTVSQLRSLLYNEYKSGEYYIKTQKGFVLKEQVENMADIKKAKKEDIKYSVHGSKLIYETECKTKNGDVYISIDEDRNIDIDCNKLTINGREVFRCD